MERCCFLWTSSHWQDHQFECVLWKAGKIKFITTWSIQNLLILWSLSFITTAYFFAYTAKVTTVWLGCFTSHSIFAWPGTFRFPPVSVSSKCIEWTYFNSEKEVKVHLEEFFTSKDRKFFEQGIMNGPVIVEDTGTKW